MEGGTTLVLHDLRTYYTLHWVCMITSGCNWGTCVQQLKQPTCMLIRTFHIQWSCSIKHVGINKIGWDVRVPYMCAHMSATEAIAICTPPSVLGVIIQEEANEHDHFRLEMLAATPQHSCSVLPEKRVWPHKSTWYSIQYKELTFPQHQVGVSQVLHSPADSDLPNAGRPRLRD